MQQSSSCSPFSAVWDVDVDKPQVRQLLQHTVYKTLDRTVRSWHTMQVLSWGTVGMIVCSLAAIEVNNTKTPP
jgi:hypothetical protein